MYISKLYISAYFCIYVQVKIIVKKNLKMKNTYSKPGLGSTDL